MARRTSPPAELAEAIRNDPPPPVAEDKLEKVRNLVIQARDLENEVLNLEERLKEANRQLFDLCHQTLPTLMDEYGIPAITIEARGNLPRTIARMVPFYNAAIAANWPEDRRRKALDWLEKNGHGDLIKTMVQANFPRETLAKARKFAQQAAKAGAVADVKESVHSRTLTAWLREQVEDHGYIPPLDLIGGIVGKVTELKTEKK